MKKSAKKLDSHITGTVPSVPSVSPGQLDFRSSEAASLVQIAAQSSYFFFSRLNGLAYILLGIACILAVVVVASTAFDNVPLTIATYAVATAVSLLPASLIAVVALSLANASKDLADRNALVRRMDAIETLAAVTDVCSDKTGTIT